MDKCRLRPPHFFPSVESFVLEYFVWKKKIYPYFFLSTSILKFLPTTGENHCIVPNGKIFSFTGQKSITRSFLLSFQKWGDSLNVFKINNYDSLLSFNLPNKIVEMSLVTFYKLRELCLLIVPLQGAGRKSAAMMGKKYISTNCIFPFKFSWSWKCQYQC